MGLACDLAGVCAGCPWITKTYGQQIADKQAHFRTLWQAAGLNEDALGALPIRSIDEGGLRDRVDLTLYREEDGMCLGLYDLGNKRIVDMAKCPMMSPALAEWFQVFREHIPEMRLGSVRLRVAPDGERGIWLDFPNAEIKRFLDEKSLLETFAGLAHVELGQRRKTLVEKGSGLGLGDPQLKPWFETYLEGEPHPLYCSVGSFTQAGFRANRALVELVLERASDLGPHWVELGAGIGNFTLPLAARGNSVLAIENDPRATDGLARSAQEAGLWGSITVERANMHRNDKGFVQFLTEADAVLADPPRSGLRAFLDVLDEMNGDDRPEHFLYISCFAESLIGDVARLSQMGYKLVSVEGLDQFPQSRHCEWVLLLKR